MNAALKAIYADINANVTEKTLPRTINLWLQHHRGADPQAGRDHAPLRIIGAPEFREVGPMEYEFKVRLRVDTRRRKKKKGYGKADYERRGT